MTTGLARVAQVWGALLRASLARGMQYRADFLLDALTGAFRTVAAIAPLWLVFSHRDALLGWSAADATLVLGLFMLLKTFVHGVIEPNLGVVVEGVRTGAFDITLLRPADAQLLVSLHTVAPGHLWDLLAALGVLGWAIHAGGAPAPLDAVVAGALLLAGAASLYGLWLLTICLAFLFLRMDNLRYLLEATLDAGRWPSEVLTGWVRWLFTVVIPVAVFTTFPAEALRGRWDAPRLALGLGVGIAFSALSRRAWLAALARYTSASS
jgi:ABC-2 type transport system permease protein